MHTNLDISFLKPKNDLYQRFENIKLLIKQDITRLQKQENSISLHENVGKTVNLTRPIIYTIQNITELFNAKTARPVRIQVGQQTYNLPLKYKETVSLADLLKLISNK